MIWTHIKTGPRDPSKPSNGLLFRKNTHSEGFRGKPRTTLPTKLDEDLVILIKKKNS